MRRATLHDESRTVGNALRGIPGAVQLTERHGGRCLKILGVLAACCLGCATYHFGNEGLFPPDVHTVFVPMIESASYRRDMGEQLTEAVCKEIEKRANFKVVGTPNADSTLIVKIANDSKQIVIREPNNEGRNIEVGLVVKVAWTNNRGVVVRSDEVPLPPEMIDMGATSNLVPEFGASTVSQYQVAMQKLAKQIVNTMEAPW